MFKYILLLALLVAGAISQTCNNTLITKCETEVQKGTHFLIQAFQYCDQAAKEKGKDQTADLNCLKWALTVEKDCWPCVCVIAKKEGWKIKGCDTIMEILEAAKQLRDAVNN